MKVQSQKIFEKLKTKPANRVSGLVYEKISWLWFCRCASTALPRTRHGRLFPLAFISVLTALQTIVTLGSIFPSCDPPISIVRQQWCIGESLSLTRRSEWQWDQLRTMKVGGNESATKYFQTHGGTAALASKDPKTKYTSNAATKYKDELKRRAAADALE